MLREVQTHGAVREEGREALGQVEPTLVELDERGDEVGCGAAFAVCQPRDFGDQGPIGQPSEFRSVRGHGHNIGGHFPAHDVGARRPTAGSDDVDVQPPGDRLRTLNVVRASAVLAGGPAPAPVTVRKLSSPGAHFCCVAVTEKPEVRIGVRLNSVRTEFVRPLPASSFPTNKRWFGSQWDEVKA